MFFFLLQNTCSSEGNSVGKNKPCFPRVGSWQEGKEILQSSRLSCHGSCVSQTTYLVKGHCEVKDYKSTVSCWFPFRNSGFVIQNYSIAKKYDTLSLHSSSPKQTQASSSGFIHCSHSPSLLSLGRVASLPSARFPN